MDRHAATRRLHSLADQAGLRLPAMHPHMLRHTFVTTMLDAGVDLRDVQIAARHADPRTTMRYDRARKNLDRHPNHILSTTEGPLTTNGTQTADVLTDGFSGTRICAVAFPGFGAAKSYYLENIAFQVVNTTTTTTVRKGLSLQTPLISSTTTMSRTLADITVLARIGCSF
jgi:hypothetical protein